MPTRRGSGDGQTRRIRVGDISVPKDRRGMREVAELTRSIAEVGLLQPIVVDTRKRLIAGRHRLEACKALGWTTIAAHVVDLDRARQVIAELDENLERHELSFLERAEALARRKKLYELIYPETRSVRVRGGPGRGKRRTAAVRRYSFAEAAAAKLSVSTRTVRRALEVVERLDPRAADLLRGTEIANARQDLVRLSKMPAETQRAVAAEISQGARNIKSALQTLRWKHLPAKGSRPKRGEHYELLVGDFLSRALALRPASVDLAIADPPWSRSWVPRLHDLIVAFAHVLRPGGRALVFLGQEFLPDLFHAARNQLTYRWTLCLRARKPKTNWPAGVLSAWLPIVVLEKPGEQAKSFRWDVLEDDAPHEKTDPWAKSRRVLEELIAWFSHPGDSVCDLFAGSGSAGVAALELGRKYTGIDVDKAAVELAAREIAAVKWAARSASERRRARRAYPV